MKKILLTGATGYIGSHTWVSLLEQGYDVLGIDNFSNSSPIVLDRIEKIVNKKPIFIQGDIRDEIFLKNIFSNYDIDSIIHFAAFKAVGESVKEPLKYYNNNVAGLLNLLTVSLIFNVENFVFSSSATVYGDINKCPIDEKTPLKATNPYGQTKLICENILSDIKFAHKDFNIAILRYFNPVGAHRSGLIGESPNGIPNNLMPYITQVAIGKIPYLNIFGGDYNTADGTGIRDYIHVLDLAQGHLSAIEYLYNHKKSITVNLGTGIGYSVLDLVKHFSQASNIDIPYKITQRREGDTAICYADTDLAKKLMNWEAKYNLKHMCQDSWNWQLNNPKGYI